MEYESESQYERELEDMPGEVKEMAKQIVKSLAQKNFRIHDAKSTLRACEIYIDCSFKINLPTNLSTP